MNKLLLLLDRIKNKYEVMSYIKTKKRYKKCINYIKYIFLFESRFMQAFGKSGKLQELVVKPVDKLLLVNNLLTNLNNIYLKLPIWLRFIDSGIFNLVFFSFVCILEFIRDIHRLLFYLFISKIFYMLQSTAARGLSNSRSVGKLNFWQGCVTFLRVWFTKRKPAGRKLDIKLSIPEKLFRFFLSGPFGYLGLIYRLTLVKLIAVVAFLLAKLTALPFLFVGAEARERSIVWRLFSSYFYTKRFKDTSMHPGFRLEFSYFLYLYLELGGVLWFGSPELNSETEHKELVEHVWKLRVWFNATVFRLERLADFLAKNFTYFKVIISSVFVLLVFPLNVIRQIIHFIFALFLYGLDILVSILVLCYTKVWIFKLELELNAVRKHFSKLYFNFFWWLFMIPGSFILLVESVYLCQGIIIPLVLFFTNKLNFTLHFILWTVWLPLIVGAIFNEKMREIFHEIKYYLVAWTYFIQQQLILHYEMFEHYYIYLTFEHVHLLSVIYMYGPAPYILRLWFMQGL